jgi:serine/threonine protein kinase
MAVPTSHISHGFDATGTRCVFKQLRTEDAHREDLALRLANEAAVLTFLSGTPGVIRLLEVRHSPLTLVLEAADNASLDVRLRGALPLAEGRRIAGELVSAVAACHRRGVVHRDIKPSNLLFVDGALRLADFGVAAWGEPRRALPEGWEEDEVGTPPWSAPELRIHATAAVSPAVDVYGVAMVVSALLGEPVSETIVAGRSNDPAHRPSLDEIARSLV